MKNLRTLQTMFLIIVDESLSTSLPRLAQAFVLKACVESMRALTSVHWHPSVTEIQSWDLAKSNEKHRNDLLYL